jgi:hypothetical protein
MTTPVSGGVLKDAGACQAVDDVGEPPGDDVAAVLVAPLPQAATAPATTTRTALLRHILHAWR